MRRRSVILGLAACAVALPQAALAQSFAEQVVAQLVEQGFTEIRIERTLLGRTRITARRSDGEREIILNPRTGEILRDLWLTGGGGVPLIDDRRGDDRDGDDRGGDDRDDDDDREDESDGGKGRGRGRGRGGD